MQLVQLQVLVQQEQGLVQLQLLVQQVLGQQQLVLLQVWRLEQRVVR